MDLTIEFPEEEFQHIRRQARAEGLDVETWAKQVMERAARDGRAKAQETAAKRPRPK